ncbi:hypothetical protein DACRYDRAFT_92421 [Dacryopinax primogenitus]|uniref:Uncharacterized protein n=1 Tax=Dacryopinax primogenitus (strain DJM 731) TaxID=1858805 RepID=M5GH06_DACPD|nr:uncharacterized protein DACRYDRAFT_92421 [Dacryopinax primogenitus]EJU06403.1 hypothetical protein DACRYDRAFT_92421 [Dacryopinax primogenitus]
MDHHFGSPHSTKRIIVGTPAPTQSAAPGGGGRGMTPAQPNIGGGPPHPSQPVPQTPHIPPHPSLPQPPPSNVHPPDPSTNFTYQRGVLSAISRMRAPAPGNTAPGPVDQALLRRWLVLAPSYLMHDQSISTSPEEGVLAWAEGMHALVGVLQMLHSQGVLEWETMDTASRAFAESWSAAKCWTGMERAKEAIQAAGRRLRALLDPQDYVRYRGRRLYPGQD